MSPSILQRQDHDLVLGEVIVGQLHRAVEDGDQVLGLRASWAANRDRGTPGTTNLRSLARSRCSIVSAVRLVTGGASLLERGLMQMRLLHLVALFGVAGQASVHRIGLEESRSAAGVRIVASRAVALRARMLHLGLLDLLRLLAVTGHADRFGLRLCQDDLAVLRRLVAGIARLRLRREHA